MAKRRIHLKESQLYGLVEQAINELDWKTYMNAANGRMDQFWNVMDELDNPNLSDDKWEEKDKLASKYLDSATAMSDEASKRFNKNTHQWESVVRRINEDVNDDEDWEYVLEYIECCDEKLSATIDWVIQACVKKARRGVVLDREHLANCYTLRRLCQIGVKMAPEYFEQRLYLSNEDKRRVREALADYILSFVNDEIGAQNESTAHRVTESIMRKLRRM